jgi:hypothetical protein
VCRAGSFDKQVLERGQVRIGDRRVLVQLDRRTDPIVRVLDAGPRQARQRQGREPSADMRLATK